ncbi:hypothetical protein [Nocardioides abyssi]|uniref:Uncharacterized protein n=2 Tax=Nocardioides TaxID=1839 RepID=A0ABT8ESH8_9ACTN|nr:hypothetical protein [Nocardioides abyssi]MDN4161113.1 hypothetical protein [Nocardioides abyssi]
MSPGRLLPFKVVPTADLTAARWLTERLFDGGPPPAVSSVVPLGYDAYVEVPLDGNGGGPEPVEGVRATLAHYTGDDERCYWAMWVGWPQMRAWASEPTVSIPDGFALVLFREQFADTEWVRSVTSGDETLWWPESRRWVQARPVDSDALYIACDRAVADSLLESGCAGAHLVDPSAPMLSDEY